MKMPTTQMVQVLFLIGFFTGPLQVLCLRELPLTMSNTSVDDQYLGCNPERELKLRKSGNIPLPEKYNTTWETAKQHWAKLGQTVGSFDPIYGTVIVAYTVGDSLYHDFNTAAREAGKSQDSYDHYAFRDFHLLLTKALQAKKTNDTCYWVFRGVRNIRFTISDKVVRFGQFASSSKNKMVAQVFGEDTFFSIKTCYGVPIDDFSYHEEQKEVLIPPYEKFIVTNYTKTQKGVFIRLESQGVFSRFNCEALNGVTMKTLTIILAVVAALCVIASVIGVVLVQTKKRRRRQSLPL